MQDIVHLGLWQLVFAYLFVLLLMGLVRWKRIPREKEIVIATVRMTLQLMLVGYVLAFVFEQGHWWYTAGAVLLMEAFAVRNIMKRVKVPLHRAIRRIIAFSMVSGTLVCILYFMLVVIRVTPWYDPRYFIPLAGMMIGNSMTGIALGVSKLVEGMHREKERVECALMLGATPKAACKSLRDRAFSDAILPTLNSMVGMGIVFLPGMMTGQILSGLSPVTAVQYQIAIMLGIVGSVSLTVTLFVQFGYRTFFNRSSQFLVNGISSGEAKTS